VTKLTLIVIPQTRQEWGPVPPFRQIVVYFPVRCFDQSPDAAQYMETFNVLCQNATNFFSEISKKNHVLLPADQTERFAMGFIFEQFPLGLKKIEDQVEKKREHESMISEQ
jgi:hypothetical protein